MYKFQVLVLAIVALFLFGGALADSPSLMTYQGVLLDASDNPLVNSTHNVTFKIYDEEMLGTGNMLYEWNFPTLTTDASGGFTVTLNNLNQTDFADTSLWLEIQVDSDGPMDPRIRLTAAPYAIRAGGSWSLNGNENPDDLFFLGTTDNSPMEFKVNNYHALHFMPPDVYSSFNVLTSSIIGGHGNNTVTEEVQGGTISGGGYYNTIGGIDCRNKITQNFGTIGGGADNKVLAKYGSVGGGYSNNASGEYSTIPGGYNCLASGDYSFAAGYKASAIHNGSFVWGDYTEATVHTTGDNQFKIRASGGVIIGGGVDANVEINDANNVTAIQFHGGSHSMRMKNSSDELIIKHDAEAGKIILYPSGSLDASIELNGGNHLLRMKNSSGDLTITNDAEASTIKLFPSGSTTGESIRLNGETGAVVTEILKICNGCDISEPFAMTDDVMLPEGALVVIDAANPGRTTLSTRPYDPCVAGVISGAGDINPGLTLSQHGIFDDGQNVALTGRVYCLATAANGAIRPGDMLTTSNIAGHAMKATDRGRAFGSVIGKAMTSLNDGEGLVLVLVNLQ